MFKIPDNPKELIDKTKTVARYIVLDKGVVSKVKRHRDVLKTLQPFRKEKLILFRTTLMYILPYLSKSFGVAVKHRILTDHYSFLNENFSLAQLRQLFNDDGLEVYAEASESDRYSVLLKAVTNHLEFEGSMSLVFKQDGATLYSLSFTFIRGAVLGINQPYIIYVSALQGTKNEYDRIRNAAKHFKENSLPVILFRTLEAVAISLDIKQCIGISANSSLSLKESSQFERFFNNYDIFWMNSGATAFKGDYLLKFPLEQKPIEQIAQSHRNRTLKKRIKMQQVAADVSNSMGDFLERRPAFPVIKLSLAANG